MIDIVKVKNDTDIIKGFPRIYGIGTSAICYKINDTEIYKKYLDTYRTYMLFKCHEMYEHLQFLSEMNNSTYAAPTTIYEKDDKIIGYKMDLKQGKVLDRINKDIYINDIFNYLDELIEDTYMISEKKFKLIDLHGKNIIYGDRLSIIDLDNGYADSYYQTEEIVRQNLKNIYIYIIKSLFKVKYDEDMFFHGRGLEDSYYDNISRGKPDIIRFLKDVREYLMISDDEFKVSDIRRNSYKILTKEKRPYGY